MSIRDVLNARRWHRQDLDRLEVEIVHRGAPGDRRVLPGWAISEIGSNGITVDRFKAGDPVDEHVDPESFIPYHRVVEIRLAGDVLWTKP